MADTSVWTTLMWLGAALLVKAAYFAISTLTVYVRAKKDIKISYSVVQSGKSTGAGGKLNVLVTGGSGFLGRHIVDLLLERFSDLIQVHVLDAGAKPDTTRPSVTYIQGDIRVPSHVRMAVRDQSAVIHCAGIVEMATTDLALMRAVNMDGTRNVVEACLDLEAKALVFTSSVAVHYRQDGADMDRVMEDAVTPPEADMVFEYSRVKRQAERLVLAANGHVVRTVALRPGGIHGCGDKFLTDLVPQSSSPILGHLNKRVPYCWVRDVARAHVMALVRLLMPGDTGAHARAAAPWLCPPAAWDEAGGSAWGWKLRDDPHYQRVFGDATAAGTAAGAGAGAGAVATAAGLAGMGTGSIAGKAFHLCYDPDVEAPPIRQFNGAGDPEGAATSAWGWPAKGTIPIWLVEWLAGVNYAIARRLGVAPLPDHLTPVNVKWVKRNGVFDISQAKALLGWQPLPWRTVVRVIAGEVQAQRDGWSTGAGGTAGVSSAVKKTQ